MRPAPSPVARWRQRLRCIIPRRWRSRTARSRSWRRRAAVLRPSLLVLTLAPPFLRLLPSAPIAVPLSQRPEKTEPRFVGPLRAVPDDSRNPVRFAEGGFEGVDAVDGVAQR